MNNNSISVTVRNNIFDIFRIEDIYFFGVAETVDFLDEFFDLDNIPTTDYRYTNAREDIWKHTIDNAWDWPSDWLFSDDRFNLKDIPDELLLAILCKVIHPKVRPDADVARNIAEYLNEQLNSCDWQLIETSRLAGRPIFTAQRITKKTTDHHNETKVMISYTHESDERRARVLKLSDYLRAHGVDCIIDQYYEDNPPAKGWPLWMEDTIERSDFVLVVCTETYLRRFKKDEVPGSGLGSSWEGAIITQELYNQGGGNTKFIPILFNSDDRKFIPTILQSTSYYDFTVKAQRQRLYGRLKGQPQVIMPPLGQRKVISST